MSAETRLEQNKNETGFFKKSLKMVLESQPTGRNRT